YRSSATQPAAWAVTSPSSTAATTPPTRITTTDTRPSSAIGPPAPSTTAPPPATAKRQRQRRARIQSPDLPDAPVLRSRGPSPTIRPQCGVRPLEVAKITRCSPASRVLGLVPPGDEAGEHRVIFATSRGLTPHWGRIVGEGPLDL